MGEVNTSDISAIHDLSEPLKTDVLVAFTNAVTDVFLYAIPIIVLALIVVLFLKEIPLRTTAPILQEEKEDAIVDELAPVTMH